MEIAIPRFFAQAIRLIQRLPLVAVLEIPYLLQMLTVVSLTSWVMIEYRRIVVTGLAANLREETTERVLAYVDHQLSLAARLNATQVAAVETGLLDLNNFEQMGRFFWQQMQIYPVDYLNYGNQAGEFIGVERLDDGTLVINETRQDNLKLMTIYHTDAQGRRTKAEASPAPDPIQAEGWYAEAAAAGHPLWSQIYPWDDQPDVLSISASHPLYNRQGQLLGVMGTDLALAQMNQFLQAIQVSPSTEIFIVERSGLLVASSDGVAPFAVVKGQAQRLSAVYSSNPLVQASAKHLTQTGLLEATTPSTLDIWQNGQRQFVSLTPWQDDMGLDWVVVVVVPEADFLTQLDTYVRTTLLLALLSLAIALLMAMLTARWINRPIQRLVVASRVLAAGHFDQTVEIDGIRELKILSSAFNRMAAQMADAFDQMESRVAQRTAELATAKVVAETANQSKNVFLANMSHQLRTPLNVVMGFIQVMERDAALTADHRKALVSMHRSADYLLVQLNNLLLASKLDGTAPLSLTQSWFDLGLLLQDLQVQFVPSLLHPEVQFGLDLDPTTPQHICTDENKLRQSLANLLENALRFTTAGRVRLRVESQAMSLNPDIEAEYLPGHRGHYRLTFAVTDTGPGIEASDLERLFNPFEQAESGQRSQQGSGLGLFICQEYVRLLGGALRCHSQPGRGSCFDFTITVPGGAQALSSDLSSPKAAPATVPLPPVAEHLSAMPQSWREPLRLAAIKGDDRAILALLADLPENSTALGDWLRHWATNFQFDIILELIEEIQGDHSKPEAGYQPHLTHCLLKTAQASRPEADAPDS